MNHLIAKYLEKQSRRWQFYSLWESCLKAGVLALVADQFMKWLAHGLGYIQGGFALSPTLSMLSIYFSVLIFFLSAFWMYARSTRISAVATAKVIEKQSPFFKTHPEHRSELVSAASFLERGLNFDESLQLAEAHVKVWEKRLENFAVDLMPSRALFFWLMIFSGVLIFQGRLHENRTYRFPESTQALLIRSYEVRLPFEAAEWESREGPLSAIAGSSIRFEAPDLGLWQTYVFLKEAESEWRLLPCERYCEFELQRRGSFSVGSLWSRSPIYPLQLIPDEEPRAVVFVEEGGELIPSATLNIRNAESLDLNLLASDDIQLTSVELVHEFEGEAKSLQSWVLQENRFRENRLLSLESWKGGAHQIYLKVSDHSRTIQSAPLLIFYADEAYLREQRIASVRSLLDEWVHILADLLESEADSRISQSLASRLENLTYPEALKEALLAVFVQELQSLHERIWEEIVVRQRLRSLPDVIEEVEKQILYGLSLIFQERAGDIQGSKEDLRRAQSDLNDLLEQLKAGEDVDDEKIQQAFQNLQDKLKELQEKMRNLPRGPQDNQINREALDEQLDESEQLEDRIAEIQKKLAEGQNEEALRELESLLNQLNILSKEIERSLDQWEENLNQGAMQSSQEFQQNLEDIRKQQESIANRTSQLQEEMRAFEEEKQNLDEGVLKEREDAFEQSFEELSKEQAELFQKFNEKSDQFKKSLEGSEWEQAFQGSEMQQIQEQVGDKMQESNRELNRRKAPDAVNAQREAVELLKKASEQQQQARQRIQEQARQSGLAEGGRSIDKNERVEVLESEGKGDRDRRRKIMNSLKRQVDEEFQESHEKYFEELLQR